MHRTLSVLRQIGWWSLLVTLTLHVGLLSASAQPPQGPPPEPAYVPLVIMTAGTTQTYQMTSKENLKRVENPNIRVLNVKQVLGDPKSVMLEALAPGRTRVRLLDQKDNVEFVEVVVVSDRVKDLRDLIQRAVPNSGVTVTPNEANTTIVLSGYVLTADDARVVRGAAKNLFGDNVIDNIRAGGVQQVQLEVVVAVVNRSRLRQMSFSWVANGNEWFLASFFGGPFNFTNNLATGVINSIQPATGSNLTNSGAFNIPFGVMHNNNSFFSYLQLLNTEGLAKVLAEPRVTTLSGRPANIVSGGEAPVITGGGGGAPASVTYKQFGTIVTCLPTVLGNGKINLEVRPELSAVDAATSVVIAGGTSAPGFKTRSAQVTVQIEDGQTLAIGGLIQNTVNATISRAPVLGDLPYLGMFFTQKSYQETEEEMIILVTPRLVDPIECCKIPKHLPGRETRVPDDFELFMEGIMEAPRGPRNVIFHPHLYQAAHKLSPNAGQIPCADGSCYGRGNAGCASGNCAAPIAVNGGNFTPPANLATAPSLPMPSFPSVPVISTSGGSRPSVELEVPALAPPTREIQPSLGPATPVIPAMPSVPPRELQNRPVLPPLSAGPYGGAN